MDWRNHPWYCTRCNVWMGVLMKHKHAEIIKAWADGAEIQYKNSIGLWTEFSNKYSVWNENDEYRIKPELKPDIVKYVRTTAIDEGICRWDIASPIYANLKIVFDAETGQLKSAEVLK